MRRHTPARPVDASPTATPSPWLWSGLVGLGSIGGVFFAVSLTHAHQLFDDNGQGGWVAIALAAVVVLLALGSTVELVRRVRMKEPIAPVVAALLLGIAIEGWGNLATVEGEHRNPAGYLLAGLPTLGTLILLWVFETARIAARDRRAELDARAAQAAELARRRAATAEEERARAEAERVARLEAERAEHRARAEAQRVAEDARVAAQAEVELAQARAQEAAQLAEAERLRAATDAAQRQAQEAQAAAERAAQAEAQRQAQAAAQARAQEAAQLAEAERLRAEEEERRRRREAPQPGTEAHAIAVALSHLTEHGELPGQTDLSRLSKTSLATAKRALKKIRETPHLSLVPPTGTTATG